MSQVLSDRELGILREIVELHLETGEPVASAAVARRAEIGLSPPSIRNVMAELEERGLLTQPHTSAGRLPSDAAIRIYVEEILHRPALPPREQRRLRGLMAPPGPLEEKLAQTSRVLARVTTEVGMAVAPAPRQAVLRSIHFVQVASRRVLAVVATQGGLVESRLLAVERDYDQGELDRISNYCTQSFAGLSLAEIRSRLIALMAEERAQWDQLIAGVVELGQRAVESEVTSGGEVFLDGTDRLLTAVSPRQLDAVRALFAAFSDKATLLKLLNTYLSGSGPRVSVGSDFTLAEGGDLGLVVTTFELVTGERGLVGVIGHKRMNYQGIIPIVDFIGNHLAEVGGWRDAG